MRGLPIKYYRYAIEQIGAVADKPSTFIFKKTKGGYRVKNNGYRERQINSYPSRRRYPKYLAYIGAIAVKRRA